MLQAANSQFLLWTEQCEISERARDAESCRGRADFQSPRDLGVGQLVSDSEFERDALVFGKCSDRRSDCPVRGQALVHLLELVLREVERQAETLPRAALDSISTERLSQQVLCDPEQPRKCGAAASVTKAPPVEPRLREGLSRQVGGKMARTARSPCKHGRSVPLIQFPEGGRVTSGGANQLGVSALHIFL